MITDSSALMAILRAEPERDDFTRAIGLAKTKLMSAGTWVELAAVLSKPSDAPMRTQLYYVRERLGIELAAVTPSQAELGHRAYLEYGKNAHPARLNFGDCFSYALSKESGYPLLFKGNDFSQTDVVPAL